MGSRDLRKLALMLRAVNVGGRQLAMADLRRVLTEAGFEDAQTLLASGNAVVATDAEGAEAEARAQAALKAALAWPTEVLARDAGELAAVIAGNPFTDFAKAQPSRMMAFFIRGEPGDLATLDPYCVAGEETAVGPGCIYATYPVGSGTSKLNIAVLQRRLGVVGTARNWNTVGKLAARLG